MGFNKVILVGNLTRDVDVINFNNGGLCAKFSLAVNRIFKDKSGERQEDVMFIDVTCFNRLAEIARDFLKKGSLVLVEGMLILESWESEGKKHYKHSIRVESMQMLGSKKDAENAENRAQNNSNMITINAVDAENEDIPF